MHINHIHANDPIPDLHGDSPVDSKPKFKLVPKRKKPKPRLRRGQQRSKTRIRRTYMWKLRKVYEWERLQGNWRAKLSWLPGWNNEKSLSPRLVSGVVKKTSGKSGQKET